MHYDDMASRCLLCSLHYNELFIYIRVVVCDQGLNFSRIKGWRIGTDIMWALYFAGVGRTTFSYCSHVFRKSYLNFDRVIFQTGLEFQMGYTITQLDAQPGVLLGQVKTTIMTNDWHPECPADRRNLRFSTCGSIHHVCLACYARQFSCCFSKAVQRTRHRDGSRAKSKYFQQRCAPKHDKRE